MSDGELCHEAVSETVTGEEFATWMAKASPFESKPCIAVAVSGGVDSMALTCLLHDWLAEREGTLVALTVDHRLRPEAVEEARWVHRELSARGIEHHTLAWEEGEHCRHRLQEAAREARYALLRNWCRNNAVVHLALGHHSDDQCETFLLRLMRGSGVDGLACMPLVREERAVRLLRPLLHAPKERLKATLKAAGWGWIDDPSNDKPVYARNRLRQQLPRLQTHGIHSETLLPMIRSFGRLRRAFEQKVTALMTRRVSLYPEGYAYVDAENLAEEDEYLLYRALRSLIMTVGGLAYPPREDGLRRALSALLKRQESITLGGCHIIRKGSGYWIVRESRNLAPARLQPGQTVEWDGRFRLRISGKAAGRSLSVRALGNKGWQQLSNAHPEMKSSAIPYAARLSLPAICDDNGLLLVPHLGYRHLPEHDTLDVELRFEPKNLLFSAPFTVA